MQIHKHSRFEILPSIPGVPIEAELQGQLVRIERAGRTCYQSENGPVTVETASRFVAMLIRSGHESVIEHGGMCVKFYDVSRGLTHEFVRHRLASPSQESTRYVDYTKGADAPDLARFQLNCILPPHRDENQQVPLEDGREMSAAEMLDQIEMFYRALRKSGWGNDDARQILPTATEAEIVVTANFREWRHIFEERTQKAAHWEIRGTMNVLLETVKAIVPAVFGDFEKAGEDKNGLAYYCKVKR